MPRDLAKRPLMPGTLQREIPTMGAEAARLTALALERQSTGLARRALHARHEAQLESHVRRWARPEGDAGPHGPGRGNVVIDTVTSSVFCPREDRYVPSTTQITRRALTRTLRALPPDLQSVAIAYQGLHERRGAMRCVDPSALSHGSGGCSDGGAAARWDEDGTLQAMEEAIGPCVALAVRRNRIRADRGHRRDIRVREIVDAIVLEGRSPMDVLGRAGWSSRHRFRREVCEHLRAALRRILDRGK
ncbi:MAG: hypothetical protein AAF557_27710 [Pseudomonadota bacterium]